MSTESRQRIAELLGAIGSLGVFAARRTAAVDDLHLEVKGIGQLRLPISRAQALKLRRIGRPARYGKGEETLLDRRVRDTWEVPKSRVKIDRRQWNSTLLPVLGSLRADLGLPDTFRLKAELNGLLVYGPGQFFAPHQDSEKTDDMIGSLVVMLPASFKGGSFVIEHQGETVTYRGSKQLLTFVAFYADCRHEVRPVRSGFRIVLTYNLILAETAAAEATTAELEPAKVDALASRLREHFETPLPAHRFERGTPDAPGRKPPSRLVYLLDHQYTERGLAWHRLKGNDATRAAALRAAAERSDCELVLALAEVHETWSCMEPGWDDRSYRRQRFWERDEDDDWIEEDPVTDDPNDYELDELVDWGITLKRWVDPSAKDSTPIVTHVSDEEVCDTTPSSALKPYASEFEGYMGNYGNTMDRWYRRAAVVVWPRRHAFAVRAEASPKWALGELQERIRAGRLMDAREMATSLSAFWGTVAPREESRTLFDKALLVADGLDAPALAESLLQPFRIEELTVTRASAFVALVERYGEDWTRRLVSSWSDHRRGIGGPDVLAWIADLPGLCEALLRSGDTVGRQAAKTLLRDRWAWLRKAIEGAVRLLPPSLRQKELARLPAPILGILDSSEAMEARDLREEVVSFLCAADHEDLLPCILQLLRKASGWRIRASAALDSLRQHCVHLLRARLDLPERGADDWSMSLPAGCRCELCGTLEAFLADPTRERLEWPLAKEGRRHVHERIAAHELPVRHETRRSGRPYTLVLDKTRALFEREARERRSWRADLKRLVAEDESQAPGHTRVP